MLAQPEGALATPSFARLLVTLGLNSFEAVFKAADAASPVRKAYFGLKDSTPNVQRADDLVVALRAAGVSVDEAVVRDFFFLKLLRNTYAHGEWKPKDRAEALARGFNTSLDRFHFPPLDDWSRIRGVILTLASHVAQALWLAEPFGASGASEAIGDLATAIGQERDPLDFWPDASRPEQGAWRTLEAMYVAFKEDRVPHAGRVLVSRALAAWDAVVASLPTAARIDAALSTFDELARARVFARAPVGAPLDQFRQASAADFDASPEIAPRWRAFHARLQELDPIDGQVWASAVPDDLAQLYLRLVVPEAATDEVLHALRAGFSVWRIVHNNSAAEVLRLMTAPPLVPDLERPLMRAADDAHRALRLRAAWYAWVERVRSQPPTP